MIRVVLPWRMLAQSNHRLIPSKGRLILSSGYRAKKKEAEWEAKRQLAGTTPVSGPVRMTIAFHEPDKRRRDPGNLTKHVEDVLSGLAYDDDSQICEMTWKRAGIDRLVPRAVITIEPIAQSEAA